LPEKKKSTKTAAEVRDMHAPGNVWPATPCNHDANHLESGMICGNLPTCLELLMY
jgi:hypothetical protein